MMISPHLQRQLWRSGLAFAVACAGMACAGGTLAQPEVSTGPFINVNGKYVLYTYPLAPYTKQGMVYVPLVSFAELLGIRVTQTTNHGAITLLLNGKTITFKQSRTQLTSGLTGGIRVPIEPLNGGELAVALPPLLDALKITYRLEASGLRITDQRFLNPYVPPYPRFDYANGLPNRYKDWDGYFVDQLYPENSDFVPSRFSLTRTANISTVKAQFNLKQFRQTGSGLSMLVYNSNGTVSVKGDGLKPPPESPPRPRSDFCQYSGASVLCKTSINFAKGGHIKYILIHAFRQP
ncbi:hypothetical protein DEFR109230_17370 [Deinococcus frigens]